MAQKQKRPSPLEDPPTASSSDSEEDQQPSSQQHDDHGEEEEEEDDDEEQASSEEQGDEDDQAKPSSQPASKTPPPPSAPKPESSDSETETDSESDSESDQPAPAPPAKVKPLASPKSKTQASATAANRSAAKRPGDSNGHVSDPKRAKKKGADSADEEVEEDGKKSGDESKKMFQRLWSEEDEIAILKGLIEFTSKTGADPIKHTDALHDFLKRTQSLHADASTNQLKQKIRRLKIKFETNAGKGKDGDNFPKPHDRKSFELSKKIWGNAAGAGGGGGGANGGVEKAKTNGKVAKSPKKDTKSNPKPKPEPKSEPKSELVAVDSKEAGKMDIDVKTDANLHIREVIRLDKGLGLYGLNEDVVNRGLELMGGSKRAELEEQCKKLQVAELELYVKRAELVANQARLILEAYKSSNN